MRLLCVKIANTLCSPIYTESVNEEIWESLILTISAPAEKERTVTGMVEYIEREKLLSDIDSAMENAGMGYVVGQTMKRYVKRVTAADVAPVRHGKWELSKNYVGYCSCSLCSDCYVEPEWVDRLHWRFCPNCGAKMDLEWKNDTTDI